MASSLLAHVFITITLLSAFFSSTAFAQVKVASRSTQSVARGSKLSTKLRSEVKTLNSSGVSRAESAEEFLNRLFDIDYEANSINGEELNECFEDGDNFLNYDLDGNEIGTARGDWIKCLPPLLVIASQVIDKSAPYERLEQLYRDLEFAHYNLCSHLYVELEPDLQDKFVEAVLGTGDYTLEKDQKLFMNRFFVEINRYVRAIRPYAEVTECALPLVDEDLNPLVDEEGFPVTYNENIEIPEGYHKNYLMNTFTFTENEEEPLLPAIGNIQVTQEPVTNFVSSSFQQCQQEEGGMCLWIINQRQYDQLPADQQGGFDNTDANGLDSAGEREGTYIDLLLDDNDAELRRSFFTKQTANPDRLVFNSKIVNQVNRAGKKFMHAHIAYEGDAFLRVFSFQHVAERLYPKQVQKVCVCDWTKLLQVVTQTDCTFSHEENDQCKFASGDAEIDQQDSVIADEEGYFFKPGTKELLVSDDGATLCCNNCKRIDDDNEGSPCANNNQFQNT